MVSISLSAEVGGTDAVIPTGRLYESFTVTGEPKRVRMQPNSACGYAINVCNIYLIRVFNNVVFVGSRQPVVDMG